MPAIIARYRAGAYAGPGFTRVIHQYCIMGNGAQVVVDIVVRAKCVIVAAVADELLVLVNQKMPYIQVLVCGKAVSAFEEEIRCVFFPGAAGINVSGPGADV